MNEELYYTQVVLEEEMRDLSIRRFLKEHSGGSLSETITGKFLLYNYINPMTEAIRAFVDGALGGRAGRRNIAAVRLADVEPEVSSYLFIKQMLDKATLYRKEGQRLTVTAFAVAVC